MAAPKAEKEDEYVFDAFEDGSSRQVGEKQVEKMRKFVQQYSLQMNEIEEALDESLSEVWDPLADPISLSVEPFEDTNVLELCKTDNRLFNKLMITFASLAAEVTRLKRHAHDKIFPPLILFGELTGQPGEGDAQIQIGRMMPFLLDLSKFVQRCYVVTQNIVRQLGSLYHPQSKIWTNSFKNIHVTLIYERLAELLVVMTSLDAVVGQNDSFKQSWAMYKRILKNVRVDCAKYGLEEEKLNQFEKIVLTVESLFEGYVFNNCIHQDFDFPGLVEVRTNAVFQREFFFNLNAYLEKFAPGADQTEMVTSETFMGLNCLAAAYFNLFRDPVIDKNWFKTGRKSSPERRC